MSSATVTLLDLHLQGIAPTPHEAVAIVLELLEKQRPADESLGDGAGLLPSPSTICVERDGAVSCRDAIGLLTPAEIATLLQQVLDDAPGVPPALLYCIARALGVVEAPPFENSRALLRALTRFERGDRREVLAGLAARLSDTASCNEAAHGRRERRRMPSVVAQLRHELRAIDRRRYEEQEARAPLEPRAVRGAERTDAGLWQRLKPLAPFAAAACTACAVASFAMRPAASIDMPEVAVPALATSPPMRYTAAGLRHEPPRSTVRADTFFTNVASMSAAWKERPAAPRKSARARGRSGAKPSKLRSALTFAWLRHLITIRNDL